MSLSLSYALTPTQVAALAPKVMSSRAFFSVVTQALLHRQELSVVRMGDGERRILLEAGQLASAGRSEQPTNVFDEEWRIRLGINGMRSVDLEHRLIQSMNECSYYAPNVNGLYQPDYNVYPWYVEYGHDTPLVDNFYVNDWTVAQQTWLYRNAGSVLMVHGNRSTGDALARRAKAYLNVTVRQLTLSSWEQAEGVLKECERFDYPLVIVSAGPGSKWIIPQIAQQHGGRVVLDIGNGMDKWTLYDLYKADQSKLK